MATRQQYAQALLKQGAYQPTEAHVQALVAQFSFENSHAAWNPSDTTQPYGDCTPYNTITLADGAQIHVWNYANAVDGIAATLEALSYAPYAALRACLDDASTTAEQVAQAWDASPWGDGPGGVANMLTYINEHGWDTYLNASVDGPGNWPYDANGDPVALGPPQDVWVMLPQLQQGDSGPEVGSLQVLLQYKLQNHVDLNDNQRFDDDTRHAVALFQDWQHIAQDHIVGPKTWARLVTCQVIVPKASVPPGYLTADKGSTLHSSRNRLARRCHLSRAHP